MNKIDIPKTQSVMAVIFAPITGAIAIAIVAFNYIASISHWALGGLAGFGTFLGAEAIGGACCYALIKCHREKDYGADFWTALAGVIAYIGGGILTLHLQSPIVIFFALSPFAYFSYSIIRTMQEEIAEKTKETEAQTALIKAQTNLTNAQTRKEKAQQNRSNGIVERFERLERETGPLTKASPEWKDLRVWIWESDNKTCRRCGADLSNGHYHCHHIISEFNGGKTEPNNLATVCDNCHIELHGAEKTTNGRGMAKLRERTLQQKAEKSANLETVLDFLASNPEASLSAIGEHIGKGKVTAKNYTDELQQAGKLAKNGHGWEVRS